MGAVHRHMRTGTGATVEFQFKPGAVTLAKLLRPSNGKLTLAAACGEMVSSKGIPWQRRDGQAKAVRGGAGRLADAAGGGTSHRAGSRFLARRSGDALRTHGDPDRYAGLAAPAPARADRLPLNFHGAQRSTISNGSGGKGAQRDALAVGLRASGRRAWLRGDKATIRLPLRPGLAFAASHASTISVPSCASGDLLESDSLRRLAQLVLHFADERIGRGRDLNADADRCRRPGSCRGARPSRLIGVRKAAPRPMATSGLPAGTRCR